MAQFPDVHGHQQARFAGIGKHKAGILIAVLSQRLLPFTVPLMQGLHLIMVAGSRFLPQRRNPWGHDIAKALLVGDIPLALHREAGQPVPRQLRQQDAADPLHAKGKAGVLQHGFMPHGQDLFHKRRLIPRAHPLMQIINGSLGIAEPGPKGHGFLRGKGVSNQRYLELCLRHAVPPVPWNTAASAVPPVR